MPPDNNAIARVRPLIPHVFSLALPIPIHQLPVTLYLAQDLTVPPSESGIGFQEKPLRDPFFPDESLHLLDTLPRLAFRKARICKKYEGKIFFQAFVVLQMFAKFI